MESSDRKKKRRSKADSEGRTYNCECGKSYFSYQALYTHKKTKHSDSITQEDLPKKKRGRPKLNKSPRNDSQEIECSQIQHPIDEKMKNLGKITNLRTCDDVFAKYLQIKEKELRTEHYLEVKRSVFSLRACINKHSDRLDQNNIISNDDYTATERPLLIPNICNFYIMNFLPKDRPEHDRQNEINFMLDFCSWLNDNDYTDLEIAITDREVDTPQYSFG